MSLTENAIDRRRCTLQCGFRYDTLRSQYFIVNYIFNTGHIRVYDSKTLDGYLSRP